MIEWNDPSLDVASDTAWRARYRRLQSWYRQNVLQAEPSTNASGKLLGSMLSAADGDVGKNFLNDTIARYARQRIVAVRAANGTLEETRLWQNMLSSMPLCFNLFGYLRSEPTAAASVLNKVLGLEIAEVLEMDVEYAPPAAKALLGDRTAFDAWVRYRRRAGGEGFIGVETKYTEPFSPEAYDAERYRRHCDEAVFTTGAADRLCGAKTNQLWRNVLLAVCTRRSAAFDEGFVLVLSCEGDRAAQTAYAGVRACLHEPDKWLRWFGYEQLLEACAGETALREWSVRFTRRYLDLSPVR